MQLVSKIANLCDHNPPTLQTGGQTDDMRLQDLALQYSASPGKNAFRVPTPVLPFNCSSLCGH